MTITLPSAAGPLAAVDIGSNSFRLEIGQVAGGRYRRIDYIKETVRLGAGLDSDGRLTEEAAERGLKCLRSLAQRLRGFEPGQVRAVATQTLREAQNRNAFLARAQDALGFPVEVISGREEARLIYAGVAHLQPSEQPRLVVDIGGRSTEMILGRGQQPIAAESFGVGCVSLSMRFFADGRLTAAAFDAAQVAAGAEFEEALHTFARHQWAEALGSSGTAGAVAQVLQASGIGDGGITPAGLRWCIERCIDAGHLARLKLPGLKAERHAVIAGGLAILSALAAQFNIDRMQAAKGALRQGVILDLHERLLALHRERPGDLRDHSIVQLQQRFQVDAEQAARVRSVAVTLFDQLRGGTDGNDHPDLRRELGWACDVHEIGLMVSHHDHHRHSAYLLAHIDAPGFSQNQQRRLGNLALGQRGGLRKVEAEFARDGFAHQLICLRLAAIKCHARELVDTAALRVEARGSDVRLGFSSAWAGAHPRTLFLLREESLAWQRLGRLRLELAA
jgi:exopolyphosphatase / guanosine-5'-triphosphate,3'-diphosphate pyrophosphatase